MKRTLCVLLAVLLTLGASAVTSNAFTKEVGNVTVPKLACGETVTIDGVIDTENEIWGGFAAVKINDSNSTTAWNYRSRIVTETELRFAASNLGIYIAASTFDDSPVRSTGWEMAPITDETDCREQHGFNGDTIIFAFDPLRSMVNSYTGSNDYSQQSPAWYCFTLNADGTTGVYRANMGSNSRDMEGVITAAARSGSANNWTLEAFIPWSEICESTALATDGCFVVDPDDCVAAGVVHNAKMIYMNRYAYDQNDGTGYSGMFLGYPDTGTVVTICRNYTVCDTIPGTSYQGVQGSPSQARTAGIYLNMTERTDDDALHVPEAEPVIKPSTCTEHGAAVTYCAICHKIVASSALPLIPHDFVVTNASTGKRQCSMCSATAGAVINGEQGYLTAAEAFAAAADGDSVKLFTNVTFPSSAVIDKDIAIDLNGRTVKCSSGPIFDIRADVVFNNSVTTISKVTASGGNAAVAVSEGSLTVNAGRYNGMGGYTFTVADGASLAVNGGDLRSTSGSDETGKIVDQAAGAAVVVRGGSFRAQDPTPWLAPCRTVSANTSNTYTLYTVNTAHTPGELDSVDASCTEAGHRVQQCAVCGEYLVNEVFPALGHTPGEISERAATCTENGHRFALCTVCGLVAIDEVIVAQGHVPGEAQTDAPTCTEPGHERIFCTVCGDNISDTVTAPATGHTYKLTVVSATCAEPGENRFVCKDCGDAISYPIPAAGHSWGEWTDGPGEGERTRVCSVCGESETVSAPAGAAVDGMTVTVNGLQNAKDIFFAPGAYANYREVKNNAVYGATKAKFSADGSFTLTLSSAGEYTAVIRFSDGSPDRVIRFEISAPGPRFAVDGRKITVSGIDDIYVIRLAPGCHSTSAAIKRAAGCRNYSASVIGSAESWSMVCPSAGEYSVAVQYRSGLIVIKNFTVG
ncbi:MAG: hypothetical protein IJR90_03780 [Clostridia bacterium]|nr:hypothetical protein [Clostridia bacterium]